LAEESGLSRGTFSMCFTPPGISTSWRANRVRHQGGTASSNPACSSSESMRTRLRAAHPVSLFPARRTARRVSRQL
jgi:hypothetical protein